MAKSQSCPNDSQFRALLDGSLPAEEQTEFAAHLEACAKCRQRLDILSGGGDTIAQMVPSSSDPCEDSEALAEAMRRLKDESHVSAGESGSSVRSVWLGFLGPSPNPRHLGRLGDYDILEVIGRGGMGTVLKARDPKLERLVAVKTLNMELASSGAARARFLREARSAAAVIHEHVVTIHAVDDTGEVPFLVMEYIVGVSLEDRIRRTGQLRLEEVLRIGSQIAAGLVAAHAQGLVHRDIKPSNILLENGVERVKITDFGLARVVHEARITQSNVVAGTPEFMSPEQAAGKPVDHRSDLFSLGCVLYAMCTGRSPFRAETPAGVIHRVIEDTPRPIREVNPDIPDWLTVIIERLLEKAPQDRIQTAGEVAEMLGQYLAHVQQPSRVQLPAPSVRPVRRQASRLGARVRKLIPIVAVACLGVLILGLLERAGVTNWWPNRVVTSGPAEQFYCVDLQPQANRGLAESANTNYPDSAIENLVPQTFIADGIPFKLGRGRLQLAGPKDRVPIEKVTGIQVNRKAAKLHFLHGSHAPGPHGATIAKYIVHYGDGTMETIPMIAGRDVCDWWKRSVFPVLATRAKAVWFGTSPRATKGNAHIQIFLCTWKNPHPEKTIVSLDFDRCGLPYPGPFCMAVTCDNDRSALPPEQGLLHIKIRHYVDVFRCSVHIADSPSSTVRGDGIYDVLLAPGEHEVVVRDGEKLIRRGTIKVEAGGRIDLVVDCPQMLFALPDAQPRPVQELLGQSWGIRCLALARDGNMLASVGGDRSFAIWRLDQGEWIRQRTWRTERTWRIGCSSIALSPDCKLLATATDNTPIALWRVSDGHLVTHLDRSSAKPRRVAFSPDGRILVSGNDDGSIDVWNVATRAKIKSVACHEGSLRRLAFSPDGTLLATCGGDATVKLLETSSWKTKHVLSGHTGEVFATAFSPDGKTLASTGVDTTVQLWNVETGQLLHVYDHPQALYTVAFSPDGKRLAAAGLFHTVRVWDLASNEVVHDFHAHWDMITDLAFTPDSAGLLTASFDNSIRSWSLDHLPGPFAPALDAPRPRAIFNVHMHWSTDVVFSQGADDLVAAVGIMPKNVQVRRLKDLSLYWEFAANGTTTCLSWSQSMFFTPKENKLIMCVSDETTGNLRLSIWDPSKRVRKASFQPLSNMTGKAGLIGKIALASDGTAVVVLSQRHRCVTMVDLPSGNSRWSFPLLNNRPISPGISPDGRVVAIGTQQGMILLLDAATGSQVHEPLRHGTDGVWAVAYSPKGMLASADGEGTVKLWDAGSLAEFTLPRAHREHIWSAAFSPDGQMLATAGGCWPDSTDLWDYKGEVCLWDVKSRRLLVKFHAHYGCVTRAVFSPSGKMLATTGRDGKMYLWNVADILDSADQTESL